MATEQSASSRGEPVRVDSSSPPSSGRPGTPRATDPPTTFLSGLGGAPVGAPIVEPKPGACAPCADSVRSNVHEQFESLYRNAEWDSSRVPWADGKPCPMLVQWLNADAPSLVRPGCRAVVVGCGLGDDVAELVGRGYDAVGFDVSETAIEWARKRHPRCAERFMPGDLLSLPMRFRKRFDLVVEIYTIQSMHPTLRANAAAGLAELRASHGLILAICRGRDDAEALEVEDGPPWPLCPTELNALMKDQSLTPARPMRALWDQESPPKRRLACVFGPA